MNVTVERGKPRYTLSAGTPASFALWWEERYGLRAGHPILAPCGEHRMIGGRHALPTQSMPCECDDPTCWLIEIRDPEGVL